MYKGGNTPRNEPVNSTKENTSGMDPPVDQRQSPHQKNMREVGDVDGPRGFKEGNQNVSNMGEKAS